MQPCCSRADRAAHPPHTSLSASPRSYAPTAKDLASRDVVSRSMTMEIREVGVQ